MCVRREDGVEQGRVWVGGEGWEEVVRRVRWYEVKEGT